MLNFWTAEAKKDDQRKGELLAAVMEADKDVLRILRNELQAKCDASYKDMLKRSQFAEPNWPYKQAHFIAQQKTYKYIIDTLLKVN